VSHDAVVVVAGWEREVAMVGDIAKKTKREINTAWIYPPRTMRAAALASADPEHVTNVTGFFQGS
jgi:NADH:quinone reductase (non-electrogenic)